MRPARTEFCHLFAKLPKIHPALPTGEVAPTRDSGHGVPANSPPPPRGRSARRCIRRFARAVDSIAVGAGPSSNPRVDLAFRPSNGRPSNPVRFREFTTPHLVVDGGVLQAHALHFGARHQSILRFRRHDLVPSVHSRPYRCRCSVTLRGAGRRPHCAGSLDNSRHSEWVPVAAKRPASGKSSHNTSRERAEEPHRVG